MRFVMIAAVLFTVFSNPLYAESLPGSVRDGQAFAQEVCSECHVVAPRQDTPATDAVPTFTAIAADSAVTEMGLRVFLQTPHAQMPNFMLSRIQTDNVISYILSLKN